MSMQRRGVMNLPLHTGRAPYWLFARMKRLARAIVIAIVEEYGPCEVLRRLSDPLWFQAFGCVLGFDWHSSGVTTTVCGALKEGLAGLQEELGIFIAGGKGKASRRTPQNIIDVGEKISVDPERLVYASRLVAKVDSAALQDGFQLYHHTFVFTKDGAWAVVQQGMCEERGYARRYHWLSEELQDFTCEPHKAICCDVRGEVLNMVAREAEEVRRVSAEIAREEPGKVAKQIEKLKEYTLPRRHHILLEDINPKRLEKIFAMTREMDIKNFENLLATSGVGPKTIRALALIAELVYGAPNSFRDPVRFSFAHGGKDGHPYPVDRKTYDKSIEVLEKAVRRARVGELDKVNALKRLAMWLG